MRLRAPERHCCRSYILFLGLPVCWLIDQASGLSIAGQCTRVVHAAGDWIHARLGSGRHTRLSVIARQLPVLSPRRCKESTAQRASNQLQRTNTLFVYEASEVSGSEIYDSSLLFNFGSRETKNWRRNSSEIRRSDQCRCIRILTIEIQGGG